MPTSTQSLVPVAVLVAGIAIGCSGHGGDHDGLSAIVQSPSRLRPWSGALVVRTNQTPSAWSVDGKARPPPSPVHPNAILDTTTLADGSHRLGITGPDGTKYEAPFTVDNGPRLPSPFTGGLTPVAQATFPLRPNAAHGGTPPAGAVAGDFDRDGDMDLFVWGEDASSPGTAHVYEQTSPLVFARKKTVVSGIVGAAGVADVDGDGWPDVVAVGDRITLLHNVAGMLVEAPPGSAFPPKQGPGGYTGVTFADVDGDGLLDVAIGMLGCGGPPEPSFVFRNEGDLHFVDIAPDLGLSLPDLATFAFEMERLEDGVLHVWPFNEGCRQGGGRHFRFTEGADLPVLLDAVLPEFALAQMGTAWLDIDGDGLLDQWIAGSDSNPLWSAPRFDSMSVGPFVGLDAFLDPTGFPLQSWSMVLFDADLDGRPDVFATHSRALDAVNAPGAGDALYWQRAPGKFRDVSAFAGLGGDEPCQVAHGVDLDADGDTDLLVGCDNGIRVLRNDLVDPAAGRTIVLHGTVSNPDGVHAFLTTPGGERRIARGGGQPFAGGVVHESMFAPSGQLSVRWPSGIEQKIDVGTSRVLHVTEPQVFTVSPRRVSVASPAPVSVTVDPAQLGDPSVNVVVDAGSSSGSWSKPLARGNDGLWRGTLLPGPATATIVLRIQVGSTTLRIRPRIFVR